MIIPRKKMEVEFRFDAMLFPNVGNENCDAGPTKY